MQQPFSDDHLRPLPLINTRAVEPNDRIHQLFNKPGRLTEKEWAELRQYEGEHNS